MHVSYDNKIFKERKKVNMEKTPDFSLKFSRKGKGYI